MLQKKIRVKEKNDITTIHIYTKLNLTMVSTTISLIIGVVMIYVLLTEAYNITFLIIGMLLTSLVISAFRLTDNELIEVASDQIIVSKRILFIRYDSKVYESQLVRNMYVKKIKIKEPINNRKLIRDYIDLSSISFEYMGERKEFAKGVEFIEGKHLIAYNFNHYSLKS